MERYFFFDMDSIIHQQQIISFHWTFSRFSTRWCQSFCSSVREDSWKILISPKNKNKWEKNNSKRQNHLWVGNHLQIPFLHGWVDVDLKMDMNNMIASSSILPLYCYNKTDDDRLKSHLWWIGYKRAVNHKFDNY